MHFFPAGLDPFTIHQFISGFHLVDERICTIPSNHSHAHKCTLGHMDRDQNVVLFGISYKHLATPFFVVVAEWEWRKAWIQSQTSTDHLLAMCPCGALLSLPVVQFPHLWDVDKITPTSSGLMRSKWVNPCKALKTMADPWGVPCKC